MILQPKEKKKFLTKQSFLNEATLKEATHSSIQQSNLKQNSINNDFLLLSAIGLNELINSLVHSLQCISWLTDTKVDVNFILLLIF